MTVTLLSSEPDLTGWTIVAGVEANTLYRYIAPAPGDLGWVANGFDDSSWSSATAWPFSYPASGTLWPPNSNQGPGYTAAVRFEMPEGIGAGVLRIDADDSVVIYKDSVSWLNKPSPASARWYEVTADEWSNGRSLAARPVDDLGNQRTFYFRYYMEDGFTLTSSRPPLRQRQKRVNTPRMRQRVR